MRRAKYKGADGEVVALMMRRTRLLAARERLACMRDWVFLSPAEQGHDVVAEIDRQRAETDRRLVELGVTFEDDDDGIALEVPF